MTTQHLDLRTARPLDDDPDIAELVDYIRALNLDGPEKAKSSAADLTYVTNIPGAIILTYAAIAPDWYLAVGYELWGPFKSLGTAGEVARRVLRLHSPFPDEVRAALVCQRLTLDTDEFTRLFGDTEYPFPVECSNGWYLCRKKPDGSEEAIGPYASYERCKNFGKGVLGNLRAFRRRW